MTIKNRILSVFLAVLMFASVFTAFPPMEVWADDGTVPSVKKEDPDVGSNYVTLKGKITANGGVNIEKYGFGYIINHSSSEYNWGGLKVGTISNNVLFTHKITGLNPGDFVDYVVAAKNCYGEASFPEEHEETLATAYTNLGVHCVRDPALLEQAAQAHVKGIAIKKRMYAEHPEAMGLWLATSYNYLGVVRLKQEKKGEAKRLFLSAVEAASVCEREELFLKRDTYALFHRNVAVACRETLQFKQAKQYERSADKIEVCRTEAELVKTNHVALLTYFAFLVSFLEFFNHK